MRKELTWEQAEAVHQCGVGVYYRFPHWEVIDPSRQIDADVYGPAKLHAEYSVGGTWYHLGYGLPSFFVEVE